MPSPGRGSRGGRGVAEERRISTDARRVSDPFCFFGPFAKEAYDLFFKAASGALSEKLATAKGLKATVNGFRRPLGTAAWFEWTTPP